MSSKQLLVIEPGSGFGPALADHMVREGIIAGYVIVASPDEALPYLNTVCGVIIGTTAPYRFEVDWARQLIQAGGSVNILVITGPSNHRQAALAAQDVNRINVYRAEQIANDPQKRTEVMTMVASWCG